MAAIDPKRTFTAVREYGLSVLTDDGGRMSDSDKVFAGSIPEIYDTYLVPLIFEAFANDIAERAAALNIRYVGLTDSGPM